MAATPNNNRASLLAGLRTGGVRSTSNPNLPQMPHTAAPGASFALPRFASGGHAPHPVFPEEDDDQDELAHRMAMAGLRTAGPELMNSGNAFQRQQQQMMLGQLAQQRAAYGAANLVPASAAEFQNQMMQLEMLKLQAIQQAQVQAQAQAQQQYQNELLAQAQRQQQQQMQQARRRSGFEPASAGPAMTGFDHRANLAALRGRAPELRGNTADEQYAAMPMTAAIGGRFASRPPNPSTAAFDENEEYTPRFYAPPAPMNTPSTPSYNSTTVISGGTLLGGTPGMPTSPSPSTGPSKSDAAVSWRRGSAPTINNSVLRKDRYSPPRDEGNGNKSRPMPLRFNVTPPTAQIPTVLVDTSNVDDDNSSATSGSGSTPSTPESTPTSLSAEGPGAKKISAYEGLGLGAPIQIMKQPLRQPRGPPSGAEELGSRNFAARTSLNKRKSLDGLGASDAVNQNGLVVVEAY